MLRTRWLGKSGCCKRMLTSVPTTGAERANRSIAWKSWANLRCSLRQRPHFICPSPRLSFALTCVKKLISRTVITSVVLVPVFFKLNRRFMKW